ncbi:uncharacterized protein LOC124931817 [Impatiens glandulifera]|uniref:uncharacterized protein LOC124931817 n=1 Tax=Impatiens glandulifera TaxID=253017 RepID=UPI001FB1162D|nr:uncharacterized protein LOC124931817 [Impatiens glandulifera]
MANFRKTQHVRSISFPARSHPATIKAEEELNKLKSLMIVSSSSSLKLDGILSGLFGLSELYNSVEEVLQLPLTQTALRQNQSSPEWLNRVLEDSIKHMDVCSGTRDLVIVLKDSLQNIQSSIRRRKSGLGSDVSNFQQSRKKMMKESAKLKYFSDMSENGSEDRDELQSAVMRVLKETSVMTLFMFQSLLSYVSGTAAAGSGKWSLVSKVLKQHGDCSELDEMEMVLKKLMFSGDKKNDDCGMKYTMEKLEALNLGMEDVEDGLDRIFRCLIRERVTLLNVLSC